MQISRCGLILPAEHPPFRRMRCDRDRAVGHRQRQCREATWRRPEHDLRILSRIVFGVVTETFQNVLVALIFLHPGGDRASGMRADDGVADDAVRGTRTRGVVQFARIELDEYDLVEPRALADDRGLRVLRPGANRRPAQGQIIRLDDLSGLVAFGAHQLIGFLRSLTGAGLIFIVGGCRLDRGETRAARDRGQHRAARRTVARPHCIGFTGLFDGSAGVGLRHGAS